MSRRQGTSTLSPLIWLAVVILILYFARAVLIPLALALTLNFLLAPMVTWLQRLRMSRVLAVAVVMLVSAAVVGEMGWVVSGQLLQVASNLPKYRQNIRNKIEDHGLFGRVQVTPEPGTLTLLGSGLGSDLHSAK